MRVEIEYSPECPVCELTIPRIEKILIIKNIPYVKKLINGGSITTNYYESSYKIQKLSSDIVEDVIKLTGNPIKGLMMIGNIQKAICDELNVTPIITIYIDVLDEEGRKIELPIVIRGGGVHQEYYKNFEILIDELLNLEKFFKAIENLPNPYKKYQLKKFYSEKDDKE